MEQPVLIWQVRIYAIWRANWRQMTTFLISVDSKFKETGPSRRGSCQACYCDPDILGGGREIIGLGLSGTGTGGFIYPYSPVGIIRRSFDPVFIIPGKFPHDFRRGNASAAPQIHFPPMTGISVRRAPTGTGITIITAPCRIRRLLAISAGGFT